MSVLASVTVPALEADEVFVRPFNMHMGVPPDLVLPLAPTLIACTSASASEIIFQNQDSESAAGVKFALVWFHNEVTRAGDFIPPAAWKGEVADADVSVVPDNYSFLMNMVTPVAPSALSCTRTGGNITAPKRDGFTIYGANVPVFEEDAIGAGYWSFPAYTDAHAVVSAPSAAGATSAAVLSLLQGSLENLVPDGRIDWEFSYIARVPLISSLGAGADRYVLYVETPEGVVSLRYDQTNTRWIFTRKGVDHILTNAFDGPTTNCHFRAGDEVTFRIWDFPADSALLGATFRACGMRMMVNGAVGHDEIGTTSGAPYTTPTAIYLGSNGTPSPNMGMQWTKFGVRSDHDSVHRQAVVQGVVLGDSTSATRINDYIATAVAMRTVAEARDRLPIGVMATGGDTAVGQLAKWNHANNHWRGDPNVKWAIIALGLNEIAAGLKTPVEMRDDIQALIDRLKTTNPGIKVAVRCMVPARGYFGETQYRDLFRPLQDAYLGHATAANGRAPLINVDARIWGHLRVLDPSDTGNMLPQFQIGDNLHTNNAGRAVKAAHDVAALKSLGFTP